MLIDDYSIINMQEQIEEIYQLLDSVFNLAGFRELVYIGIQISHIEFYIDKAEEEWIFGEGIDFSRIETQSLYIIKEIEKIISENSNG